MVTETSLRTFIQAETERAHTSSAPRAFLRVEGKDGQKRLVTVIESSCLFCRIFQWLDRVFFRKYMYSLEAVANQVKTLLPSEDKSRTLQILKTKVEHYNVHHKDAHIRIDSLFSDLVSLNNSVALSNVSPEDVEKFFWEYVYDKGRVFLQILARNEGENAQKAQVFVDAFLEHQQVPADDTLKKELAETMLRVFDSMRLPTKHFQRKIEDDTGRVVGDLWVYDTRGDGACAFHALLGSVDTTYICKDHEAKRAHFCVWLSERKADLPEGIKNVIEDHFFHYEHAPGYFKTPAVSQIRETMYRELQTKTEQTDREAIVSAFIQDETVFTAYLKNLSHPTTFLLQEELIACAECFGLKLELFQPGWMNDSGVLRHETFNADAERGVHVYYNGSNHFCRADLVSQ